MVRVIPFIRIGPTSGGEEPQEPPGEVGETITTMTLANPQGTAKGTRNWRFGAAFPEGAVPSGHSVVATDTSDNVFPTQTSLVNRWPDGSIKCCTLIVRCSQPAGGRTLRLKAVSGAPNRTPGATPAQVASYLQANGDVSWRISVWGQFAEASALRALNAGRSRANGQTFNWSQPWIYDAWISGPLCVCYRVMDPFRATADNQIHPVLRGLFDLYVYLDGNGNIEDVQTDAIIQNGSWFSPFNGIYIFDEWRLRIGSTTVWVQTSESPAGTLTPSALNSSDATGNTSNTHMWDAVRMQRSSGTWTQEQRHRPIVANNVLAYYSQLDGTNETRARCIVPIATQAYALSQNRANGETVTLRNKILTENTTYMRPILSGNPRIRIQWTSASSGASITFFDCQDTFGRTMPDKTYSLSTGGGVMHTPDLFGRCRARVNGSVNGLRLGHGGFLNTNPVSSGNWAIKAGHMWQFTRHVKRCRHSTKAIEKIEFLPVWDTQGETTHWFSETRVIPRFQFDQFEGSAIRAERFIDWYINGRPNGTYGLVHWGQKPTGADEFWDIQHGARRSGISATVKIRNFGIVHRYDSEGTNLPDYELFWLKKQTLETWKLMWAMCEVEEAFPWFLLDDETGRMLNPGDTVRTNRQECVFEGKSWNISNPTQSLESFRHPLSHGDDEGTSFEMDGAYAHAHHYQKASIIYVATGDLRWYDAVAYGAMSMWANVGGGTNGTGTARNMHYGESRDWGWSMSYFCRACNYCPEDLGADADVILPRSVWKAMLDANMMISYNQIAKPGVPGYNNCYVGHTAPPGQEYANKGDFAWIRGGLRYNPLTEMMAAWGYLMGVDCKVFDMETEPEARALAEVMAGTYVKGVQHTKAGKMTGLLFTRVAHPSTFLNNEGSGPPTQRWPIQYQGETGLIAAYQFVRDRFPDAYFIQGNLRGYSYSAPKATLTISGTTFRTSAPVFRPIDVGSQIAPGSGNGRATITQYVSPTEVRVSIQQAFGASSYGANANGGSPNWKLQIPKGLAGYVTFMGTAADGMSENYTQDQFHISFRCCLALATSIPSLQAQARQALQDWDAAILDGYADRGGVPLNVRLDDNNGSQIAWQQGIAGR